MTTGATMTQEHADGSVEKHQMCLIPEGEYLVSLVHHRTVIMFGRQPKLILGFRVVDGKYSGSNIAKYYNVRRLTSKAGMRGSFKVSRHSDYLFDYVRLHGAPSRIDRLPMKPWRNCVLRAQIRTVTKGRGGRILPQPLQYSKVDQLIEKVAGVS